MERDVVRKAAAAPKPESLVSPPDLAAMLDIPEHTLAQWRSRGTGPAYIKVGRHVRYRWSVVDAWLQEQTVGA